MDEHREFYSIHLPHLINYVVPVAQLKKGQIEIGSGVLVRASGRHFVATARHCIDGDKVRVVRSITPLCVQESRDGDTRELRVLQRGWHDTLDLGYLEIADPECPELVWDQLRAEQIVQGRVQIVGYPEVLTRPIQRIPGTLTDVSLCAGTFGTSMTEATDDRLTFDYPTSGYRYDEATGEWHDSPFPDTPRGFSGGACFGVTKPLGDISRVEYNLLGIQYAWLKPERVVRVVPISRWRELVTSRGLASC